MRLFLLAAIGAALGAIYLWMNKVLVARMWLTPYTKTTGWALLPELWPVALGGLVVGAGGMLFWFGFLYTKAEKGDLARENGRLREQVRTANIAAELAVEYKREKVEAQELRAIELQQWAEQALSSVASERAAAQLEIAAANAERDRAIKAASNASGGFERKKQKISQLQQASTLASKHKID